MDHSYKVVKEHKTIIESPPEVVGAWPILGHLLQLVGSRPLFKVLAEMSDNYGPIFMVRIGMHPTLIQMIAAASDTTSITLTWAVALLITNPIVLRKAQDELDTRVGKDRNVEEHDINDLVYLQAVVKETLRMYPPAPLGAAHEAIMDCNIGGYEVRAGTHLLVNVWKLHRDPPRVWSNPSEFKPEMFLPQLNGSSGGEAADLDFRGQDFKYLPFGSGRGMCPGIDFALQTVHMALARLLHAFEFDNDLAGLIVDMTEGSSITLPKLTPLEVYLRPRLSAKLY
ncbi:hypothetical protein C5167_002570 [Papaver somniferum]|uniref:Cytochrome P450 n=1 Tax=Papaver somniferum TaxID=3469 RepID=A0A4Y7L140_PAPSO|nr:cytochrome P450 82A3-like [Papaver somniferum]RZC78340.1 hypothetical protein C5167_002570 [Papaver somniferum]